MRISRSGIHGFHETLGVDQDEIRFYWTLESEDNEDELATQTAYQIIVREASTGKVESAGPIVWDTGRCDGPAQRDIVCKPNGGFRSTCAYSWRVSVWDHLDHVWHSQENTFVTAYPRSQLLPPLSMNQ
jgi:hypothetical protein